MLSPGVQEAPLAKQNIHPVMKQMRLERERSYFGICFGRNEPLRTLVFLRSVRVAMT